MAFGNSTVVPRGEEDHMRQTDAHCAPRHRPDHGAGRAARHLAEGDDTFDLAPHSTIWLSAVGSGEVAIAQERPARVQTGLLQRARLWGR
jgi:hypothetical protein